MKNKNMSSWCGTIFSFVLLTVVLCIAAMAILLYDTIHGDTCTIPGVDVLCYLATHLPFGEGVTHVVRVFVMLLPSMIGLLFGSLFLYALVYLVVSSVQKTKRTK